ncbi:hypothetical protein GWI33_016319 [Rhynchophorus ferrugineus]|uniref:Uncharacterized protein n=1 Tax=Rhynchophorus ferrugineus TaxID=354439 RepID=A0A834HXK3_RHYFE|nr:hypothetical protein GWI33_016319 [Rhynchophorus ferrugineus]
MSRAGPSCRINLFQLRLEQQVITCTMDMIKQLTRYRRPLEMLPEAQREQLVSVSIMVSLQVVHSFNLGQDIPTSFAEESSFLSSLTH